MEIEKMRVSQENFNFWFIFDEFLLQLRPPERSKLLFFHWKNEVFLKNRLLELTSILGTNMGLIWVHLGFKNSPKSKKSRFSEAFKNGLIFALIFDRFGVRFGSQVGVMLAPKIVSRRPKRPPRRSQRLLDGQFGGFLMASWSWLLLGGLLMANLGVFCVYFGFNLRPKLESFWNRFSIDFTLIFHRLFIDVYWFLLVVFIHFSLFLDPFWNDSIPYRTIPNHSEPFLTICKPFRIVSTALQFFCRIANIFNLHTWWFRKVLSIRPLSSYCSKFHFDVKQAPWGPSGAIFVADKWGHLR